MADDCLFCKIVERAVPSDIVYEDDTLLAFNDISPQAPTHVLIIPKTHIATVNDLTDSEAELIGKMALCGQSLACARGIDEGGYRLILNCNALGGQTVFHVHLHLLGGRQLRGLG
ncbi:MAG: histidine triad nucleotide-binding protein [Gammaproteobacteria bacterium]|nr:histidine triad nucleotide-binding protein [Gammaproteobacteria bacterium]